MVKDMNSDLLKQDLLDLMKNKGISQASVARELNRSASVLSSWLSKEGYKGDKQDLEARIRNFVNREKARGTVLPKDLPFVKTSIARKIFEVAELAHLETELTVIIGEAGIGKTESLLEFYRQNPEVILIQADLSFSAQVLFCQLCDALGESKKGTIQDKLDRCVTKLKGSGRLIIVDEAEHLPYRALDLLRRVYDKAGVGVLLAGMPRLYHNLRQEKGDYAQLYSRVGVVLKLPAALSDSDAQLLVQSMLSDVDAEWAAFNEACGGNARKLAKLVRRSKRISEINHIPVDADVVKTAASMLMF